MLREFDVQAVELLRALAAQPGGDDVLDALLAETVNATTFNAASVLAGWIRDAVRD